MRVLLLLALFSLCGVSFAQDQEIQRALIQRDQQSTQFAAQLRGPEARAQLEALHARQLSEGLPPLSPDPALAAQLQRGRMSEQHELRFAPPRGIESAPAPAARAPLPLPGGPRPGVDPVAPDGVSR